jgi:pyruvate/2-oxoglutarate/acetoin dehydrogenase E1 component
MSVTEKITGSILLRCQNGVSDKEYKIELVEQSDDNKGVELKILRSSYGRTGKLSNVGSIGEHSFRLLDKTVTAKIKKGYEIVMVNGRPFTSGSQGDAMRLMTEQSTLNDLRNAQPVQRIRARDVEVTFDIGQCVPIW